MQAPGPLQEGGGMADIDKLVMTVVVDGGDQVGDPLMKVNGFYTDKGAVKEVNFSMTIASVQKFVKHFRRMVNE